MQQSPPEQRGSPSAEGERFELIDALRGFALAGVLLVNLGSFTLYNFLDSAAKAALPTARFDRIADAVKSLLVEDKAITLFSMLFGLGFALQLQRAEARGAAGLRLYLRRIGVLLLFGVVHSYLFWWGDILLIYALMGLLLLVCRKLSQRMLLALGLFVALAPALVEPWIDSLLQGLPTQEAMEKANLAAFLSPHWALALAQNFMFSNWSYLAWWGVFPFVLGRFLLGYWAGRSGLLQRPDLHRSLLLRLFLVTAFIGSAATLLGYLESRIAGGIVDLTGQAGTLLFEVILRAGPLALGIAYAAAFTLLFLRPSWRRYLRPLAPVGRMALTNYLLQTAVCVSVFYGAGLGIGPRYGYVGILSAWLLLFGAQMLFSHWWLSRYRYGPMEWLWRSLTYARRQPLKRVA